MTVNRKKYTPAEKSKIALEAIKGELTLGQLTAKYSVHATQINAWKKQALALLPDIFSDKKKQHCTNTDLQISSLYEQIGRLKVENDYLKKKSEMFNG